MLVYRGVSVVLVMFVAMTGSRMAMGRIQAFGSLQALNRRDARAALDEIEAATESDPLNAEYHLNRAELLSRSGDSAGAEREYRRATEVEPIGKTYYRYGKFLAAQSRPGEAIGMFEKAGREDPHYLQNLLALAGAYRAANRPAEADRVYDRIVRLHRSPLGELRAIPEQIPWEFAFGYFGLAEDELASGQRDRALDNLEGGCKIMEQWWSRRSDARNYVREDLWQTITQRYDWAQRQAADILRQLGKVEEAAKQDRQLADYRSALEKANADRQKEAASAAG